jgi:hypothetical protein
LEDSRNAACRIARTLELIARFVKQRLQIRANFFFDFILDLLLIGFPTKKMLRRLISLELESMMLLMNALQFTITGQMVTVNLKCATGLLFGQRYQQIKHCMVNIK